MIDIAEAILHEAGAFTGLITMIHMNLEHLDLNNMMMDNQLQDILIYTREGWIPCKFEDVYHQLAQECRFCLEHVKDNEPLMREQIRKHTEK